MSDEGLRGPSKTAWDLADYVMDPYFGLARSQGGDAWKTGENSRRAAGPADANLLPRKARKAPRPTTCQVDGCGRDLSSEKAYLQRYSVCDVHFKAEVATVHGQEMRFCQQCNKFQDLREFEGVRRSCAARSKDRNLRRRLQKGLTAEEHILTPAAAAAGLSAQQQHEPQQQQQQQQQQHQLQQLQQQQSGSPGRSGIRKGSGAVGNGSDDSGSRPGSGDASLGGSGNLARRAPEGGSGGSEYSLDVPGSAAMAGPRRGGVPAAPVVQPRHPTAALGGHSVPEHYYHHQVPPPQQRQQHRPSSSDGNGGGASSGNLDASGQDGHGGAWAPWMSAEQMGQSYDIDAGLSSSLAAVLARRGAGPKQLGPNGRGAGGLDGGPAFMDMDGYQSHPSAPLHDGRYQQASGVLGAPGTFHGGGAGGSREQGLVLARKMAVPGSGETGADAGGGWAGPAALSLLDNLDGYRPQQHNPHAIQQLQPARQAQQQQQQAGFQRGSHAPPGTSGSMFNSWGSGVGSHHPLSLGADSGRNLLAGQQHHHHQPTLGGFNDESSADALLEQLQGAVMSMGPRASMAAPAVACAREDWPNSGAMSQGQGQGHRSSGGLAGTPRAEQLEDGLATAGHSGPVQLPQGHHQQQQQSVALSALVSGSSNPRYDELSVMVKERREALIRQQLLQQQHRQQQQPAAQQQSSGSLLPQEHLQRLGLTYSGKGPYTQPEQLQLRLLSSGPGGGSTSGGATPAAAFSQDDCFEVGPTFVNRGGGGGHGAMNSAAGLGCGPGPGSGGAGRLYGRAGGLSAAARVSGAAAATDPAEMERRQPPADPPVVGTAQLLEQYALGLGGDQVNRLGGGGLGGYHGGAGRGHGGRALQQNGTVTASGAGKSAGGTGGGGGGLRRYDSDDFGGSGAGGGGPGFGAQGTGDRTNGAEGTSGGGGSSRLLTVLFPSAGGREDALAARVCLKLFSCMPEDLPGDMLMRLRRWALAAESDVIQIFMRPGCVHLLVNMRLTRGSQDALDRCVLGGGNLDAAVVALRGAFESSGLLHGRRVVVQAAEGPRGAFEYDGTAGGQARWVADADLKRAPSVLAVQPAALLCDVTTVVAVKGQNLGRPGTRFYARCGGRSHELHPLVPQPGAVTGGPCRDAKAGEAAAAEGWVAQQLVNPHGDARSQVERVASVCWGSGTTSSCTPLSLLSGAGDCGSGGDDDESQLVVVRDGSVGSRAASELTNDVDPISAGSAASLQAGVAITTEQLCRQCQRLQEQQLPQQPSATAREGTTTPPPLPVAATGWPVSGAGSSLEVVWLAVPALPRHGLVAVEAICSDFDVIGAWAPAVVCHDPEAAAELNRWLMLTGTESCGTWLLKELGVLLDYDAMLPSLMQQHAVTATSTPWGSVGTAAAAAPNLRDEGSPAAGASPGLDPSSAAPARARPTAVTTVRGGHQRALQHTMAASSHAQQHREPQGRRLAHRGVAAAASNPLPRAMAGMSGIVAAAAAGALSAVQYRRPELSESVAIASARHDGSRELGLLPAHTASPAAGQQLGGEGRQTPGPARAGRCTMHVVAPRVLCGQDAVSEAPEVPWPFVALAPLAADRRLTLPSPARGAMRTDDTKVFDASGRLLEPSMRRLLAHPLLDPGCRRAMLFAGSRLLAFSVASGLQLLANGLMEWLVSLESPVVDEHGMATAPTASWTENLEPVEAKADVFGRVAARAAITTMFGVTTGAGVTAGGHGRGSLAGTSTLCEPLAAGGSSSSSRNDSRPESVGAVPFRNLGSGLSLLHLAVASCNTSMLLQVLDWAEQYGRPWPLEWRSWPGRVTALHLAAAAGALPGGGEAARLLLSLGPEAQDAWLNARDAKGRTPAAIAQASGLESLNWLCLHGEEPCVAANAAVEAPAVAAALAKVLIAKEGHAAPGRCDSRAVNAKGHEAAVREVRTPSVCDCGLRCDGGSTVAAPAPRSGQYPVSIPPPVAAAVLGWPLLLGALLVLLTAIALRALPSRKAWANGAL